MMWLAVTAVSMLAVGAVAVYSIGVVADVLQFLSAVSGVGHFAPY